MDKITGDFVGIANYALLLSKERKNPLESKLFLPWDSHPRILAVLGLKVSELCRLYSSQLALLLWSRGGKLQAKKTLIENRLGTLLWVRTVMNSLAIWKSFR